MLFLPMIDLNPSDMTCVISTLWYIEKDAARYGLITIVTFDQPFWWKAMVAIESEPFHSELDYDHFEMRLLGAHDWSRFS